MSIRRKCLDNWLEQNMRLTGNTIHIGVKNADQEWYAKDNHDRLDLEGSQYNHDMTTPVPQILEWSYDSLTMLEVLEHVRPDKHAVVWQNVSKMLRHGGTAYVSFPFAYPVHPSPHDYCRPTPEFEKELLEEAGLLLEQVVPNGGFLGNAWDSARWFFVRKFRPLASFMSLFNGLFTGCSHEYPAGWVLVVKKA